MTDFREFGKIPRLSRECVVTEKIDGTNASVFIGPDGEFLTGSRTRWITPDDDNFGFSRWAHEHKDELLTLGLGHHFGEWWGKGIQRNYGLDERRWSLFNTAKWADVRPACCHIVPVLYQGPFDTYFIDNILMALRACGSRAMPGFMAPEGVVVYHVADTTTRRPASTMTSRRMHMSRKTDRRKLRSQNPKALCGPAGGARVRLRGTRGRSGDRDEHATSRA